MKWLKTLRQYLYCSQAELATHLGISRDLLAQAETNKRDLPTSVHLQALRVYAEIQSLHTAPSHERAASLPYQAEQRTARQKAVENLCNCTRMELHKQREHLQKTEEAYRRACTTLAHIDGLKQSVATLSPGLLPLLDQAARKALAAMKKNDLVQQEKIHIQLHGLHAILAYTQQLQSATPPPHDMPRSKMAFAKYGSVSKPKKKNEHTHAHDPAFPPFPLPGL